MLNAAGEVHGWILKRASRMNETDSIKAKINDDGHLHSPDESVLTVFNHDVWSLALQCSDVNLHW